MIEYENLRRVNEPFFQEFLQSFDRSLKSGWYILGKNVEQFEREFAAYCGVAHCVGVASGLDALTLSLMAYDFPPKSEILVPANTYIATIMAILRCGLRPVLVEPDPATYTLDPERLEDKISAKTVGIMAVHLYGKVCAMDRIAEIANRHKLRVFEDCAQAHGASFAECRAGAFGNCAAFSFYPTKNLGALGDGGAVTTDDAGVADKIRMLRNYGSPRKYYNESIGLNSRLDEVQAAFLSVKLARLDDCNKHKRLLAAVYQQDLDDRFVKPVVADSYFDVYHIYAIRHPRRDALKTYLAANGVGTEIHYPIPPHQQKALKGLVAGDFPITEEIHTTTLSLPVSTCHKVSEIRRVIEIMNRFEGD